MLLVRFVSEAKVIDRHSNNCSLTKSDKSGIQNIVQPSMFLYLSLPVAVSHCRYILVILHTVRKKGVLFSGNFTSLFSCLQNRRMSGNNKRKSSSAFHRQTIQADVQ